MNTTSVPIFNMNNFKFYRFFVCIFYLSITHFLQAQQLPTFEETTPCPFGQVWLNGRKVTCGYLTVLEDRSKPQGRKIKLAVAIIKSHNPDPVADPVLYLSGGPGAGALASIRMWLQHPLLDHRDLIVYDQRGTGYSEPVVCQALNEESLAISFGNYSLEEEVELRYQAAMRCKKELIAQNIDYTKYNSEESARDIEALRMALGYDKWNLYGISYGTRLALTTMRLFPTGIRSVVIDGVIPPNISNYHDNTSNFVHALNLVFQQCAVDEDCKQRFPNLEEDFYALIEQLHQNPLVVTNPDSIYLNAQDFEIIIHQSLYSHQLIPFLPLLIEQVKLNNEAVIQALLKSIQERSDSFNYWMMHAVNTYDVGGITSRDKFLSNAAKHPRLKGGFAPFQADTKVFESWVTTTDSLRNLPVSSTIPTLILSGEFDPITPPFYANEASKTLANSYSYTFSGLSHGASISGYCPVQMVSNFIDQPSMRPDDLCLSSLKSPRFVTDLWLNKGIHNFASQVLQTPSFSDVFLPIIALLTLFTAFAFYPMYSLIQRLRKQKPNTSKYAKLYKWFGWGIATLGLVYVFSLLGSIIVATNQSPIVLVFGLPKWASFLRYLPWTVAFGGLFILLFSTWLWKVKRWVRPMRIHFIMLGIAASYIGALGIYYGLF